MLNFKPSGEDAVDLVESSDDLEANVLGAEEDVDSPVDSDDDSEGDIGEEAGVAAEQATNPFFVGSDSGSDLSDSSDEEDEAAGSSKEPVDEEDELIKALKAAREKKVRNCPPDIKTTHMITDLSFHPEADLVVVGTIDGDLSIFSYSNEINELKKKLKISKKNLRGVEFDESGSSLLTISKDKTFRILDTETWTVKTKYLKCHDSPLYSVACIDPNTAVTGDEDGFVKMWDTRVSDSNSVMTFKRFDEYVSSFIKMDDRTLVAASGEGTIQSFDLRQRKPDIQSEMYDGELNCLGTVRKGDKLVVGSGTGQLYLFSKGQYGLHSDQFPGHPDGVNSLVPITDNVLITGCEDGMIRAVHLYPHRFLGVVGHHEGSFPVEQLDVNTTGELVASVSHDNRVKFWNVAYLEEMDYDKTKKPTILPKSQVRSKSKMLSLARETEHQLPSSGRANKAEFFSGFKE
jgi:WD40 repeat protein